MKRKILKQTIFAIVAMFLIIAVFSCNTYAIKAKEEIIITYVGATEYSEDMSLSDSEYKSDNNEENALLISGGKTVLTNPTVTKTGSSNSEEADFYGTNAAILVYNGATLNIESGSVTTDGGHANGVFACGSGIINIANSTIKTSSNNSGGIMVTGGGTLTANNLNITTDGNSSAAIRSDRGGGTISVDGGTYTTNGVGSPAIYSTADIVVNNATLISTASEGTVVEGANKITLNNVTLTDTNTTLNGNSETYKNIFLYQSMSGDAEQGNAEFTARNSNITTNKGDTIYVTNTDAIITLDSNTIVNNDGDFLRAEGAKWGTAGQNGGKITLTALNQIIEGNIVLDDISTLDMIINKGSKYSGTINAENKSQSVVVALDSTSTLTLTGDSHVSMLINENVDNSNINLNGFTLYVGEETITETEFVEPVVNTEEIETQNVTNTNNTENKQSSEKTGVALYIVSFFIVAIVLAVVVKKTGVV